jgi:putative radical SAM enzyme (TIGR03279 family)
VLSTETAPERTASRAGLAGGLVAAVEPGSAAERAGIRPGDRVLALDGQPLVDELTLRFFQDRPRLRLTVRRGEEEQLLLVRKPATASLGLQFAEGLFDGVRECNNRCSFCFLKGLPAGLRRSLYFKDDDYRLSFLSGSFVTLTNLSPQDWQRIARERLSPLYVSVHATDPDLRRALLGNPTAPDIREQLRWLRDRGIQVHTQLVILPGVNDGAVLARSIEELAALTPSVQSIGVVPVGLSERGAFSQHLSPDLTLRLRQRTVRPRLATAAEAREVIALVTPYQRRFRRQFGRDLVYLADEYYLRAGMPVPPRSRYDGYPQYQNGIGMVRDLLEEAKQLRRRSPVLRRPRRLTAVCGELVAPVLQPLLADLMATIPGLTIALVPVRNRFFGPSVTASGLLTRTDVEQALRGRELGDALVIPRAMLDSAGQRFLDEGTPTDLGRALGVPVVPVAGLRELVRWVARQ